MERSDNKDVQDAQIKNASGLFLRCIKYSNENWIFAYFKQNYECLSTNGMAENKKFEMNLKNKNVKREKLTIIDDNFDLRCSRERCRCRVGHFDRQSKRGLCLPVNVTCDRDLTSRI